MSVSKKDLGSMHVLLNLQNGTKDEIITSVSNKMLEIIRDSASDIADLIDNDDNIEIMD